VSSVPRAFGKEGTAESEGNGSQRKVFIRRRGRPWALVIRRGTTSRLDGNPTVVVGTTSNLEQKNREPGKGDSSG